MPERPWMKFYPADWQADQALRICSLAARGLWVECMAIMHRADPYGHLVVNGQPPTDTQLAVLVGASPGQIPELLGELATAGVFSRTRKGVIYSRRMTRDDKKAKTARKNGKNGGNPTLSNVTQNPASDKGKDKGGVKAQRPETRDQKDSEPIGSGAIAPVPEDLKSRIFGPALTWLAEHTGKTERALRPMLGKWCRDHGDGAVLEALQAAARAGPIEPIAWIEAKLNGTTRQTFGQPFKTSELLERMAENEASGIGEEGDPEGDGDAVPLAIAGPERGAGSGVPNGHHRELGAVQSDRGRASGHVGEVQTEVDEDDMADAGRALPSTFQ